MEATSDDRPKADLKRAKATLAWALKSEGAPRINAMLDLARSEPGIPILPNEFDRDPWLLNCWNGTLDLRTGQLREHRREDYITKLCPTEYDPSAEAPLFRQFLSDVFRGDEDLIDFVQRFFGYCLTGDVREQVLPIFWGGGSNGKSTLVNAVMHTLGGDYAIKANRDLFMAHKQDNHPAQMARLSGKRLVVCVETAEGGRLDETLVKELTGGDPIPARRMREDWWEFLPTHKPILVTNHKPEVRGTDHALWRRLRLVPFEAVFEGGRKDKTILERLKSEAKGILRLMVDGCTAWQRDGLGEPEAVMESTQEYRDEHDRLAFFLAERCVIDPKCRERKSALYADYQAWCKANGEYTHTATAWGRAMEEKGLRKDKGRRNYLGVRLKTRQESSQEAAR
jgi:putative DNA primase/helicase